jgi:hypothetical protein
MSPPLRVSPVRQAQIAAMAERVAVERFGGERVDPEEIARAAKVSFDYGEFPEDFDGILMFEAPALYLVCNERRALRGAARSRFTFAHELGHYFISEHRRDLESGACPAHFSLSEFRSQQPIEKEADIFAANLLMPASAFREKARDLGSGMQRISALSTLFSTSFTATGFRAMELDVFPAPAAIYFWDASANPTPKRWMSPSTYRSGLRFTKGPSVVPVGSSTAEYIAGRTFTTAAESDCHLWFPGHAIRIIEEVMPLGPFGWATVIYGVAV